MLPSLYYHYEITMLLLCDSYPLLIPSEWYRGGIGEENINDEHDTNGELNKLYE